jgi:hypothetical protein
MEVFFPREALEPFHGTADLGSVFGRSFRDFGLLGIPHAAGSLEPYLAPYGYLAVNESETGAAFGQECGLKVTIANKMKGQDYGYPALDKA